MVWLKPCFDLRCIEAPATSAPVDIYIITQANKLKLIRMKGACIGVLLPSLFHALWWLQTTANVAACTLLPLLYGYWLYWFKAPRALARSNQNVPLLTILHFASVANSVPFIIRISYCFVVALPQLKPLLLLQGKWQNPAGFNAAAAGCWLIRSSM